MIKIKATKFLIVLFTITVSFLSNAQNEISWNFSFNKENQELVFKATLSDGWHIYSQFLDKNEGPVATTFKFDENDKIEQIENVQEPEGEIVYDENFASEITYFSNEVSFIQPITTKEKTKVTGSVLYMICDDNGCLPPDVKEFSIKVIPIKE